MPGGNPAPGPTPGAGKKGENGANALWVFMDLILPDQDRHISLRYSMHRR